MKAAIITVLCEFSLFVLICGSSMATKWKTQLRAWLIDLVREAIRIEQNDWQSEFNRRIVENDGSFGVNRATYPGRAFSGVTKEAWDATNRPTTSPQPIHVEPSFEQMQTEALKELEKYYEPAQN